MLRYYRYKVEKLVEGEWKEAVATTGMAAKSYEEAISKVEREFYWLARLHIGEPVYRVSVQHPDTLAYERWEIGGITEECD
jgi:hypothetical protein